MRYLSVVPPELPVANQRSLATEQVQQLTIAKPPSDCDKLAQTGAQCSIVGSDAAIPHQSPICAIHLARIIGLAEPRPLCRCHDGRGSHPTGNIPGDTTTHCATAASVTTCASVGRSMIVRSRVTDGGRASECQGKRYYGAGGETDLRSSLRSTVIDGACYAETPRQ